jgi:hypothetical protein
MKPEDVLALVKAHPQVVSSVVGIVGSAATADASLVPDAIAAYESKNYARFAIKHLALVQNVFGALSAYPDAIAALSKLWTA